MNYVYLVWNDNGESYEDNFRFVERVFSTPEKAEKYLTDECKCRPNKTRFGTTWDPEKPTCPGGKSRYCDCPEEECPFFDAEIPDLPSWEREFSNCKYVDILDENYWERTFYTIEEIAVDEEEG